VSLEVLCFEAEAYTDFGFGWFTIGEVILREACFFGDICIANPALYAGSIYDDATGGVNVDEVAVTQVIVKRNDVEVPNSPFNNVATYGAGAPLCVQYPDYVGQVDNFTFELQVWVPSATPGTFTWQTYATLTTTDALAIPGTGAQGVFDYAIGTCSPNSTNIYTWLAALVVPPVVTFGYSNLIEAAGMRIRGNSSGNEIYMGIPDLAIGSNRVEVSYPNVYANWSEGTYAVTFTYVKGDNKITMSIYNAEAGSASLEYDFDALLAPGCASTGWNTMDINVVDRLAPANLRFNNVVLDGFPLGDFGIEGWNNWTVSGYDFSQGFVLTGDMVVTGAWTGSETNKLQLMVGCK
jgi:hypothetical protein